MNSSLGQMLDQKVQYFPKDHPHQKEGIQGKRGPDRITFMAS